MYPELFTIPFLGWPVTSFGAMMAAGFLSAYWLTRLRMAEEGFGLNAPVGKRGPPSAKEQEA